VVLAGVRRNRTIEDIAQRGGVLCWPAGVDAERFSPSRCFLIRHNLVNLLDSKPSLSFPKSDFDSITFFSTDLWRIGPWRQLWSYWCGYVGDCIARTYAISPARLAAIIDTDLPDATGECGLGGVKPVPLS